jgi:tyrosine-protein kinase Etk/Wzc
MNQSIQRLQSRTEKDGDTSNVASVLNIFLENRWLIAGVAFITALLGMVYALSVKPVYEANILIQVKDSAPPAKESPGDLPAALDTKTQTATEVEVLRSRAVLSRAIDVTHLDISVEPKYFPILGTLIARGNKQISNPGVFGFGGYVWGAEQANISMLTLPAPLLGRPFILTAESDKKFLLTQDEMGIKFEGNVGEIAKARTEYGDMEILVTRLAAKAGAQFSVTRIPRIQAVEKLQKALMISEKGRQSNVIGVTLKGSKPELISSTLNEIGTEYIRQNVMQKSEEAEKALAFFNQQLPDLKQKLERSESKSTELRSRQGTFNVTEEASALSQQSVAVQARLADVKQKKEELLSRFTEEHPSVALIDKQIQELNRDLATIKGKIKKLPAVEQEVLGVTRDKQVSTDIYTGLLSMGRQLGMVEPGRIANVRLLDRAETPVQPVTTNRSMMIAVACLAGLLLGVIAAFLKNAFLEKIRGPREIEQALGLMVCATIPHSANQKQMYKKIRRNTNKVMVLPHDAPSEGTIESLRSFRSTLQFAMRDSERNIIMITGPTPEVGKSFICANFATVLASVGKRVLLIDGDMRTGYLHRYFGVEQTNGLSDVMTRMASIESVIHKEVVENVDFISTGSYPNKPAELLAHANFGRLLRTLSARYDYVLIDTAPVLDFSDALIVGAHAEAIFNVVRDGVSSINETDEAVSRLNRAGLTVTGVILNDLKPNISRYGYGSRYATVDISPEPQGNDAERVRLIRG